MILNRLSNFNQWAVLWFGSFFVVRGYIKNIELVILRFCREVFGLIYSSFLLNGTINAHVVKLKATPSVEKTEVIKNFCKLILFFGLHHEKTSFFIMEERSGVFFLIFTMKLSSTTLNYLNAHSTLNFARTFFYFQTLTQSKHQRSKFWVL